MRGMVRDKSRTWESPDTPTRNLALATRLFAPLSLALLITTDSDLHSDR